MKTPATTLTNFGPKMGKPPEGLDWRGRVAWAAGALDTPEVCAKYGREWLAELRAYMEENTPWLLPADHPLKIAYHAKQGR